MFGPPGHAYVYLVYGMYDCLNVVTEAEGRPAALLVRAVEPTEGVEAMRRARLERGRSRRGEGVSPESGRIAMLPAARLASGPGLVCTAFSITRADNGLDLCDPASPLRLELPDEPTPDDEIATSPRIGVVYAGEPWVSQPWRFAVSTSPAVSGRRISNGERGASGRPPSRGQRVRPRA